MKHGWAFMEAITRAIEAWSRDVENQEAAAFFYRGADLRHAVERTLFFRFANDAGLQSRFDDMADGKPVPPTSREHWHDVIAAYLSPDLAAAPERGPCIPPLRLGRRIRNGLGSISRICRQPYEQKALQENPDILFLAIHPKFINFMAPVANEIGTSAAFLALQDPVVEEYLARKQLPYVVLRGAFTGPKSGVLRHFPELCEGYDCMAAVFDAFRPRLVVVPEGNAPVHELALRAGLTRNVATTCLQHGAPAYSNPGFRNWNFADVLVWGSAFIAPYARHNPGQHFTVTGTPALIPVPRPYDGSNPINSIGFFLQKGATVIPEEEWDALLRFIGWVAATFPGIEIIIRDHPTQPSLTNEERKPVSGLANVRFMPAPRYSLYDALNASDIVVAAASTTLLEAVQGGAIPFIFGTAYPKDFPDIAGAGAAIAASDNRSAEIALRQLIDNEGLRTALRLAGEKLRPSLFAASGAEGAARIAAALHPASSARPPA